MNVVADHYNANLQQEWDRLDRHRTEMAVTLKAFHQYLPLPPARLLDVGCGPGRYAIQLAQQSYITTIVDIAVDALAMATTKAGEAGVAFEETLCADATSLPDEWDGRYDAVLLMGPLYHLLEQGDRLRAVCESHRVLAPGGTVFAAFISRFAPIRDLAINSPSWITEHPDRLEALIRTGKNPVYVGSGFPDSYFAKPEEIKPLMEAGGFTTLNLIGCEGILAGHEQKANELTGELWEKWVVLNYALGQETSLHGAADHLLYIGRKQLDSHEQPIQLGD